jgi:hypothetical protein
MNNFFIVIGGIFSILLFILWKVDGENLKVSKRTKRIPNTASKSPGCKCQNCGCKNKLNV